MGFRAGLEGAFKSVEQFVKNNKKPIVNTVVAMLVIALIASLVAAAVLSARADFSSFSTNISAKLAVVTYSTSVVSAVGLGAAIIAKRKMSKMEQPELCVLFQDGEVLIANHNGVVRV